MKIACFHLMPYRDLPDDFEKRYWCAPGPDEIMDVLFHDPAHPDVVKRMTPPQDRRGADQWQIDFIWTLGCTGKAVWPIPDKGLKKRIHRISAPSLVVWGEDDKLIPPAYAEEFGRAIAGAEVFMVPRCGHEPPLEQRETLSRRCGEFLAA